MKLSLTLILMMVIAQINVFAQPLDDILNLLVQKNLIKQNEADSIRVDAEIKNQDSALTKKSFPLIADKAMQLSGYIQARYQIIDEPGKKGGFDIRRARLDLKGIVSPSWFYRIQIDLAVAPKLLDAYAELKIVDGLNFTIGQFKVPFSIENLTSSKKLEIIDRSQVVEALVARSKDVIGNQNGRDIGLMAGGSLLKIGETPMLDYRLGMFNGAGINVTSDNNERRDFAGRMVLHPLKGLDLGGSYYNGIGNWTNAIDKKRNRLGFDVSYDFPNASLRSEYIKGWDNKTIKQGYYVQAGYYMLPKQLQIMIKYDTFDPSQSINDKSTWYVLGMNYYMNPKIKIQIAYYIKEEENAGINNNAIVIQQQIGF